jgi:hypothetical protein
MSRKWKRMAEHLEANGKRAPATVVEMSSYGTDVEKSDGFSLLDLVGLGSNMGERYHERTATLLVKPKGEDEFEVKRKMRFAYYTIPDPGEKIEVLYDPADHDQVMVAPAKAAPQPPEGSEVDVGKVGFTLDLSRLRKKK